MFFLFPTPTTFFSVLTLFSSLAFWTLFVLVPEPRGRGRGIEGEEEKEGEGRGRSLLSSF